jgi:uncharacterized DUF497 family protein
MKIVGFIWLEEIVEKLEVKHWVVFFIHKLSNEALIVSAREMDDKERKSYAR